MTFKAGQVITAAGLLRDSDYTTLTDDTTSVVSTWEQWGTEEIVFSNPGVAVRVSGTVLGRAFNNVDATTTPQVRVAISFDGGSTFTSGQEPQLNIGTGAGSVQRATIGQHFWRSGTPTGDVVVRAEIITNDLSTDFRSGSLIAIIEAE